MAKPPQIDLNDLVEIYTEPMYSWAVHKVTDHELAKDLVQDTFLAAAESVDSFKGNSSAKTWLFSILNHKVIDHYRKKVRCPMSVEDDFMGRFFTSDGDWKMEARPQTWEEDEPHLLDNEEFLEVLQKCLEALPENWRTAVNAKYLLQKNGEEICQELNITPTNFWQIIHRAKLQLRDCVHTHWFNT